MVYFLYILYFTVEISALPTKAKIIDTKEDWTKYVFAHTLSLGKYSIKCKHTWYTTKAT